MSGYDEMEGESTSMGAAKAQGKGGKGAGEGCKATGDPEMGMCGDTTGSVAKAMHANMITAEGSGVQDATTKTGDRNSDARRGIGRRSRAEEASPESGECGSAVDNIVEVMHNGTMNMTEQTAEGKYESTEMDGYQEEAEVEGGGNDRARGVAEGAKKSGGS